MEAFRDQSGSMKGVKMYLAKSTNQANSLSSAMHQSGDAISE